MKRCKCYSNIQVARGTSSTLGNRKLLERSLLGQKLLLPMVIQKPHTILITFVCSCIQSSDEAEGCTVTAFTCSTHYFESTVTQNIPLIFYFQERTNSSVSPRHRKHAVHLHLHFPHTTANCQLCMLFFTMTFLKTTQSCSGHWIISTPSPFDDTVHIYIHLHRLCCTGFIVYSDSDMIAEESSAHKSQLFTPTHYVALVCVQ